MPLDFVIIRAGSIPSLVNIESSKLKAGITGSDIIWEAGMGRYGGYEIPISQLIENYSQPALYVGVTQEFAERIRREKARETLVADLTGYMVATKYPRITGEYLSEKSVDGIQIFPVPGTDEAMQYVFDSCVGILGIMSSGRTIKANDIEVLEIFYQVTVRMIECADKLTRRDRELLDDFKELIAVALQRKRMIR